MFDAYDRKRIKEYLGRDFPELANRIAIRSFNPPPQITSPGFVLSDTMLSDAKTKIKNDFLIQSNCVAELTPRLQDLFDTASEGGLIHQEQALKYCFHPLPATVTLDRYMKDNSPENNLYYITHFSSKWPDNSIYKSLFKSAPEKELPDDFGTMMQVLHTGCEIGMVVQQEMEGGPPSQDLMPKAQTLAYIFGAACLLNLHGNKAIPSLERFINATQARADAREKLTIAFLAEPREKAATLRSLGAKEALIYAENLFN